MSKTLALAILGTLIGAAAYPLYERFEYRRWYGPTSRTKILKKAASWEQYSQAVDPCPGYPKAVIVIGPDDNRYGDCDGDGYLDEVSYPLSMLVIAPLQALGQPRGWSFVLRPGVTDIEISEGPAGGTIYPAGSEENLKLQKEFERLKKVKESKYPPLMGRARGRPKKSPVFYIDMDLLHKDSP